MTTKVPYSKEDPETIQSMFGNIAKDYDRGNAVLSFSMHRIWNAALVQEVTQGEVGGCLLDLCAGTGDIAFQYLKKCKGNGKAILLDFCGEMLAHAKEKAKEQSYSAQQTTFIQADAQKIPLEDSSVNHITVAYGIRNVKEPRECLKEALRVLRPGGTFGILELTRPNHPLMKLGHSAYLKTVLPVLGKMVTSDKEAYDYLCNSIHGFISPHELEAQMREVGFVHTVQRPLMGGIATVLTGRKRGGVPASTRRAFECFKDEEGRSPMQRSLTFFRSYQRRIRRGVVLH